MIFITGDIHGCIDIHKFSSRRFAIQKELTRSDYVIICGDFGLRYCDSAEERYWLKWLDQKPWTTLWIDGNHENFDMLKSYTVEKWKGGKIQKITDNIIHLCRGSVFEIDGKRIFAFGGADSHDKHLRKPDEIWEEELPDDKEMIHGRHVLDSVGWKVDVVVTLSLPSYVQTELFGNLNYTENSLTDYFDELDKKLQYSFWFSGHYHISGRYDRKHIPIYNDIVKITDNGVERVYPK